MGLSYTILAGLFQIAAVLCGILAYKADKKVDAVATSANIFKINGDYVNGDKNTDTNKKVAVKKDKRQEAIHNEKSDNNKIPIENNILTSSDVNNSVRNSGVNNGIINSGVNNGTQTVNNVYKGIEPRQLNKQDIEDIKYEIPLDYKINIDYVNSTEESTNYAEQIFLELKKNGYIINSVNSIGMLMDGRPNKTGDRYYIKKDDSEKVATIVIKEQK
jgi:hypothetical protein